MNRFERQKEIEKEAHQESQLEELLDERRLNKAEFYEGFNQDEPLRRHECATESQSAK